MNQSAEVLFNTHIILPLWTEMTVSSASSSDSN